MPTLSHASTPEANAPLRRLAAVGQPPGLDERPGAPVTKYDVETTIKDARRVIGLTTAEVMLIDVLMALTPKADWLEGRPLVFASNRTICRRSGFGERHLSRLLASLEAKGVVLRHYSANGKRWGLRGADDTLVDGRGVDLSPLIAQVPDWRRTLADHSAAEAAHARRARTTTERRVRLREAIDAFVGSAEDTAARELLERLDAAIPNSLRTSRALRALQEADLVVLEEQLADVEADLDQLAVRLIGTVDQSAAEESNESARADSSVIHHTRPSTQPNSCSSKRTCANAQERPPSTTSTPIRKRGGTRMRGVSVAMLREALPTFWGQFAWVGLDDLQGFLRAAEMAKTMIRVDETLWGDAHVALGHNRVLVAMLAAYVFERLNTPGRHGLSDPDKVGGYFRRCVERAAEGRLHLDASLYAAAQRNRKAKEETDDDLI